MAQAANQRTQNFGRFALRGIVALNQQHQFAMRKHLAFILDQNPQQSAFGGCKMLDLVFVFDLAAGKVNRGTVFEARTLPPIRPRRC